VARRSKKGDRAAASALLLLVIVALVILAVAAIRHRDWHTGTKYILWAFIPLAIILGFTLPVRCRVKTTRSTACGNQAYGLLLGCSGTAGHHWGKFRRRLGLQADATYVGQPRGNRAVMYQPAPRIQTMRLTIEDSLLTKCGFWVGVVSAMAGVIQVIAVFTVH
jgi:hypothetical protein